MRRLFVHLSVSLLTFLVGVLAATFWLSCPERSTAGPPPPRAEVRTTAADPLPMFYSPTHCTSRIPAETPEEKAVRLAEEFVARNGYTDLPPDRNNLTHESIEWSSDVDELLSGRRGTLERSAYGIRYPDKAGRGGWMVAFRYRRPYRSGGDEVGRVVTMDRGFKNLRVEHQGFLLKAVEKRL